MWQIIITIIMEICSVYPVAQSTEQAYTHNVHQDGTCYPKKKNVYMDKCSSIFLLIYIYKMSKGSEYHCSGTQ